MFGCARKSLVKSCFAKNKYATTIYTQYTIAMTINLKPMDLHTNYNIIYLNSINGETLSIFNMCLVAPLFSQLTIKIKNL